jgi:hypothetical protein
MNLRTTALALILCAAPPLFAQEPQDVRSLLESLTRLRINGYIQAEYVHSDGADEDLDTFRVRRGRINFAYQFAPTGRIVFQPDFSSSGVTTKDAFVEIIEPWTSWRHTATLGQFKVPFGYELPQSPRDREMPESTLAIRTLFPGEWDRGLMIGATGIGERFHYRVGVVNGNGIAGDKDNNSRKDFVARAGASLGPLDVALSGYRGEDLVSVAPAGTTPLDREFPKDRLGIDAQWTTPLRGLGLRAEYLQGTQPPAPNSGAAARETDVDGWSILAVQNLGPKHQLVLRADRFDPDTDHDGDATLTAGGAYSYLWDANTKFVLAYEQPRLEDSDPDNVVTIRVQYAF